MMFPQLARFSDIALLLLRFVPSRVLFGLQSRELGLELVIALGAGRHLGLDIRLASLGAFNLLQQILHRMGGIAEW